ncbi:MULTISPECIES: NAD(P)/FAD-dependent oxidoreductase [Streptomyces]|uniref:NAD(P)/FAD-dependent oxidoreductase n=1 Tax=Streptomyces scabiei TaxID=1930 RepID=UPI001B3049AC|nr:MULTISPECIES: NAD(P)/FAD-dependent oxidoreductase [Streptomyces]MBP5866880.1 FAD-dependent oxidoreductase [Streptomyces sp. LBUM 1485]MBP5932090.1 FAD-dependent oxidoreductase [Streptomyces sp. LBUM 1479]MBP5917361.1 FAD-dependent oxidoreductase [Streptomyces sp. LBUM 1486]MDX3033090.1 NAD(P)/FAD-dependent oxidoreductase [Streptomyces scabiei]MDX3211911.1 NAD(P)/FAD-dependent oxidoreductase [Streptomyces scabiei]
MLESVHQSAFPADTEDAESTDVIVVGAGVAGLAAAGHLTRAGLRTTVLEAGPAVGGRMSTEKVDGFRLDRTTRLLSTSYPELRRTPGLDGLPLRPFAPGVLLHADGRHQRAGATPVLRSARGALTAARALASAPRLPRNQGRSTSARPGRLGAPADQSRLAMALARLAATAPERLLTRTEVPVAQALTTRGFPPRTIDGFVRPLLAALLADPALETSSRCADLALHTFATGRLCIPEGGADTLPELLAAALPPGSVRTGVEVTAISTTSVTTAHHGVLTCRAVVLATDARSAAALLPGLRVPAFHPVTVLHHATDEPPLTEPALLLDADRSGPVSHTAVISQVDPSRAPAGRSLITSVVLGTPPDPAHLDATVRAQLARLYRTSTTRWELLAAHHVPEAVPAMPAPHDLRRPVRLLAGLYVCGDHRDTSTVQGALHSARRAAHAVLTDLDVRPALSEESLETAA